MVFYSLFKKPKVRSLPLQSTWKQRVTFHCSHWLLSLAKHRSVHRNRPVSSSSMVVTSRKFKAPSADGLFEALDLHPEQHRSHEAPQKHFAYASYTPRKVSRTAASFAQATAVKNSGPKCEREAAGVQCNWADSFYNIRSRKLLRNSSALTIKIIDSSQGQHAWQAEMPVYMQSRLACRAYVTLMDGVCFCKYKSKTERQSDFSLLTWLWKKKPTLIIFLMHKGKWNRSFPTT